MRGTPFGIPAIVVPDPRGYFREFPDCGSIGEVAAVDDPERG
jgi:hypothetical protein